MRLTLARSRRQALRRRAWPWLAAARDVSFGRVRPKLAIPVPLVLALLCAVAPSAAQSTGELRQPIINGEDDRREVYDVESEVLRARARQSVVALASPRSLGYEAGGLVSVNGPTLGEAQGLCSGEAFAEQPILAWCSGVLVDDDLVATAGHCLGSSLLDATLTCRELALVFGFLYAAEGQLAQLSVDDVYRCRSVAVWSQSDDPNAPDLAVVQLDRPVVGGLAPASFAEVEAELGQRVNLIGFGSGLPAKVDSGGVVTRTAGLGEYFRADTDTFGGSSGSALFDDAGRVLGLHVRGELDWSSTGQCTYAVRGGLGFESHQRASSVVQALCDASWPSPRLCGTEAVCGDAICSPAEACPNDCPPARCGDGRCEGAEPGVCDVDCPSFQAVPSGWICPPAYYGDRLGCDCGCGARDVDCDDPGEQVLGCVTGATCDERGVCLRFGSAGMDAEVEAEKVPWRGPDDDARGDSEPQPYDDLLVDERDLQDESNVEVAKRAGGGCALAVAPGSERWVGLLLLLLLLRRRRSRLCSLKSAHGPSRAALDSRDEPGRYG